MAEPKLAFAFQIEMMLGKRMKMGKLPGGAGRGFTAAAGGIISGPKLQGKVVPNSGGDWPTYRPDGVVEFTARYVLEASDGALILMENRGFRHASPEILRKMEALEPVDPESYYFRIAPRFEAPAGPHDWMNRTVFVGAADRRAEQSIFRYWEVL